MNKIDIINLIIQLWDLKSYLEIGISDPLANFSSVVCDNKVGVDPAHRTNDNIVGITSDKFFLENSDQKFDLIFIDGDHTYGQVTRDVTNSIRSLSYGGAIVMHDCCPPSFDFLTRFSCGECFKAFLDLRKRCELTSFCVDCDYGVGICIPWKKSISSVPEISHEYSFDDFNKNRVIWQDLISPDLLEQRLAEIKHV